MERAIESPAQVLPNVDWAQNESDFISRQIPFCLFTDPELARIGLSEREAKELGIVYRLFKIPMEAVMRATTLSETRGFLKALVETNGDRILGFTAVGTGA